LIALTFFHVQFLQRSLLHGESFLTVDGSVIQNAVFFSQQLDAWSLLLNEFKPKFIASAAVAVKCDDGWKMQQVIKDLWISFKTE
jgi:hypothetical protein